MKLFANGLAVIALSATSLMLGLSNASAAPLINGAGATFPAPIYTKWAATYFAATGVKINYQGVGSSAGIDAIKKGTVDFGATDAPLTPSELSSAGLLQFPAVIGSIVMTYNLDVAKTLVFNGSVLGDIYAGKITKWNDAAIAKLNPGVALPAADIKVVRRSDGSGTTYVFTDYLARTASGWSANKSPTWAGSTIGGKGNDGVAALVKQLPGSIGYVEYAFSKKSGLKVANLVNKDGKVVAPTAGAFAQAASKAVWTGPDGTGVSLNNQSGAGSWPITSATYVLMREKAANLDNSIEVIKFFNWAMTSGGSHASALDYIPLPANVVNKVRTTWGKVK